MITKSKSCKAKIRLLLGITLPILVVFNCAVFSSGKSDLAFIQNPGNDSLVVHQADVKYTINDKGSMTVEKHLKISIGKNPYEALHFLFVAGGSLQTLEDYHLKVLNSGGDYQKFNKENLMQLSTKSADMISEENQYIPNLNIEEMAYASLDLITIQGLELPQLGIQFTPVVYGENALQITSTFEYPHGSSFSYSIKNDSPHQEITSTTDSNILTVHWTARPDKSSDLEPTEQRGKVAVLLASAHFPFQDIPGEKSSTDPWIPWGDWYLDLIQERLSVDPDLVSLAQSITENQNSDLEKIESIYHYIRNEIRYEQVYLELGEFVPNSSEDILTNRFGDCKDYSLIMHVLARAVDVKTELALCYRGRGQAFYEDIPVSQFNHMILHYKDNGNDYWMDGTNRIGRFGVTATDLNNQVALILEPNASHLVKIEAADNNLLDLQCDLQKKGTALVGKFTCVLQGQYAIDLNYPDWYLNTVDMDEYLQYMFQNLLSDDLIIDEIRWGGNQDEFRVEFTGNFPNALISHRENTYFSPGLLFKELKEAFNITKDKENLFFYPGYNKVHLEVGLNALSELDTDVPFKWSLNYEIPIGPYQDEAEKTKVFNQIKQLKNDLNSRFKLKEI